MKINAIIFGATGMVGEGVLFEALKHDDVESVLIIGRRSYPMTHPKLRQLLHHHLFDYSSIEPCLKGYNACFFYLGVSSVGMKEADYARVTHDLTMQAGSTLATLNPDLTFCYVSGMGTDGSERGRSMWARLKGQTENDLAALPFKAAFAFRPGLMKPTVGQRNVKAVFKMAGFLYPALKRFFPKTACTLEDLGLSMIHAVQFGYPKRVLENEDIPALAKARNRQLTFTAGT